jgi:hypothetical protein
MLAKMRHFAQLFLFVCLAMPLSLGAIGEEDWRRVDASPLQVRERPSTQYRTNDTLPAHLPVLVVEIRSGWCNLDAGHLRVPSDCSDGLSNPLERRPPAEHHCGFWVPCDRLLLFTDASPQNPESATKRFLYVKTDARSFGKLRRGSAKGFVIALFQTYFEVLHEEADKPPTILYYDGNALVAPNEFIRAGELVTLQWDIANNLPIYRPPQELQRPLYERYLRFITLALGNRIAFWSLVVVALVLGLCSAMGKRDEGEIPGATLAVYLIAALMVGSCQSGSIKWDEANISHLEASADTFKHLDLGGKILPFRWDSLPGNRRQRFGIDSYSNFTVGNLIWVPILALAHLLLLMSVASIVRGAHFLFAPAPSASELLRLASDGKAPPPWVSQNWIRHVGAQEARLRRRIAAIKARRQKRLNTHRD